MLLLLTSCGTDENKEPVAAVQSPIQSAEPTVSPSASAAPSPSKSAVKSSSFIKGEVVSCRQVKFHSKPENDLLLNCLNGEQGFNVGAIEGPAIINIWGSWCPPCVQEIPIFVDFFASMDRSIQLIGVDYQDGPLFAVKPYIEKAGILWPNFADPDGAASVISGKSVPVTWFVDSSNTIVYKKFGPVLSLEELKSLSNKYLGVS